MTDRWTDDIVDRLTGPDAPGLEPDAARHLAGCRHCQAAVRRAERLDDALAMDLRGHRTDELPRTVLTSPSLPARRSAWRTSASLVAATATLGLAAIATGIALNPPAFPTPSPVGVSVSQGPIVSQDAPGSPAASSVPAPQDVPDLDVGRIVAVVNQPDVAVPLVVRTEPGTADPATITPERLHTGMRVRLVDGPVELSGYPWYRVTVGEVSGWVAAETRDGSAPWLDTVSNGEILYTAAAGDQLETTDVEGSSSRLFLEVPLASAPADPDCATGTTSTWSADGSFAVITVGPACGEGAIYRIDADRTDALRLALGRAAALSRDGTRIAFMQLEPPFTCLPTPCGGDLPGAGDILVQPLQGEEGPVPLSGTANVPYAAGDPAWAPNGLAVAFTAERQGRVSVAVFDGSDVRMLADGFAPAWSPDGKWLVYANDAAGDGGAELYRIRPDGGDPEPIGPGDPGTVAFSPDGTLIGRSVTAADGSVVVAVAPFERDAPLGTVIGHGGGLTWSPDGDYLAWSDPVAEDEPTIWVARADGSDAHRVGTGTRPAWRPIIGD